MIGEDDPSPLNSIGEVFRADIEIIVAKAQKKQRARRYGAPATSPPTLAGIHDAGETVLRTYPPGFPIYGTSSRHRARMTYSTQTRTTSFAMNRAYWPAPRGQSGL